MVCDTACLPIRIGNDVGKSVRIDKADEVQAPKPQPQAQRSSLQGLP